MIVRTLFCTIICVIDIYICHSLILIYFFIYQYYSIDSLLKSCPTEGFMKGEKMLSFLPLHKSTVKRSGGFLSWIRSWWSKEKVMVF